MDTQTLNRDKGDLNFNAQTYLSSNKYISIQSSEKTQSLSIISNYETQLVVNDILAIEGQIDNNLFDQEFKFHFIVTERIEFHNIEQIKNQRLLIEYSQNCIVYIGMIIGSQQQIAIKEMQFQQEEELIKILDEFKIQNKLNKLYPKQSLLLFTPVKVQKLRQSYGLKAAMEKAETNLFVYSTKNEISANQAFTIFRQLLKQLINMHSLQIAHRDVKPQNIFYVNNKGWLLSDFGESYEYEELESNYNIRGTLFFLMPYVQQLVSQGKQITQNLLVNDLYALVITIIIIQKIQTINLIDIQQEIKNLADFYLIQSLNIKTYQQLVEFDEKLQEIKEEFLVKITDNYYKQLSYKEEQYNKIINYQSWIQLCSYYIQNQIFPDITTQLFQLIIYNLDKIQQSSDFLQGNQLFRLRKSGKQLAIDPTCIAKDISKINMRQKELVISLLFDYGYSERTILYCQQILKNQYNQFIHLKLIDSLERLKMYSEALQQFNIFQQGLIFEQLNSEFQQQVLLKIQFYGSNYLQIDVGQKFQDLLTLKNIEQVDIQKFQQDLNQQKQQDKQNPDIIINLIEMQIKQYCSNYDIFSFKYFFYLLSLISDYSLNVQQELYRRIYNQKLGVLDMTRRISILFELGSILILQDNMTKLRSNVKILQNQIFRAESQQQNITFKIQILVLKYTKLNGKKCTHSIINKLYSQISNIKHVSYHIYKLIIQEYLLYFLKQLFEGNFNYISPTGIKVVILIINHIHDCKYYQQNYQQFQLNHLKSQNILIKQQNFKRQLKLIRDYQDNLSQGIKSCFQHISGYKLIKNHKIFHQNSGFQRQKEFLFQQFLQKE